MSIGVSLPASAIAVRYAPRVGPLGPRFDVRVPPAGYAWWYMDVVADDGKHALTLIAFVGAAFSPAYYRARTRQLSPDPLRHCAINVALHGPRANAWALTEYGPSRVARTPESLRIGDSRLAWSGSALEVSVDERTPWLGRRVQGTVRVLPEALFDVAEPLDPDARHLWWCLAPTARVDVEFDHPDLHFSGTGYLDANYGREPLERGLGGWDWCRARSGRDAVVLYDTVPRRGAPIDRAWRFTASGQRDPVELPSRYTLPRARWGMARRVRADAGHAPRLLETLEDGPFYARSLVRGTFAGRERVGIGESISLDRFQSPLVRTMLPFRMRPRWLP